MVVSGKVQLDNLKGFSIGTSADGVTTVVVNDGKLIVTMNWSAEAAMDIANGIRRSVSLPGTRVTSAEMREMRAKS
jgi:hypothetical protein